MGERTFINLSVHQRKRCACTLCLFLALLLGFAWLRKEYILIFFPLPLSKLSGTVLKKAIVLILFKTVRKTLFRAIATVVKTVTVGERDQPYLWIQQEQLGIYSQETSEGGWWMMDLLTGDIKGRGRFLLSLFIPVSNPDRFLLKTGQGVGYHLRKGEGWEIWSDIEGGPILRVVILSKLT